MKWKSTVLALDLSRTCTGWAFGERFGKPVCGSVRLGKSGDENGRVLSCLANFLEDSISVHNPRVVVFEAPIPVIDRFSRLAFYMAGTTEMICYEAGVRCLEENVGTVRSKILGRVVRGSGERLTDAYKRAGMDLARSSGLDPKNDNESDAFVLWQYYTRIVQGAR